MDWIGVSKTPASPYAVGHNASESTLTGRLQVVSITRRGEEHYALFLETAPGALIELRADAAQEKRLRRLQAGTPIALLGEPSAATFSVSDLTILGTYGGVFAGGDQGTGHYAPTFGERSVAVLLVNFLDNPSEPGTPDQAQSVFDDQINDYFTEASYNQVTLSTDVYGWWTLPYTTSRCTDPDLHLVSAEILEEAQRRGVDLSLYDHLVYVFNEYFGAWCGNALGTVSPGYQGKVWRTWTGPTDSPEVAFDGEEGVESTIHELGHNLGLWHANRLDCGVEILGESCNIVYYGDFYDAMGSGPINPHFNAFHKERLGWISRDPAASNRIDTVTMSGTYAIAPYAVDGGTKALRIRRGPGADGGVDHFYLELRQPIGWDAGFKQHAYEGLLVHLGNDTVSDSSRLLNMTPEDIWEHVLRPGQAFYDLVSDVTIELISVSSEGAIVDVIVGTDITPPSVSIDTPGDGEVLDKGSTVTITARAIDETAMGQVDFFVDGVLECTTPAPFPDDIDFTCAYKVPKGKSRSLLIEVRAVDAAGNPASASVAAVTGNGDLQGKGRTK